MKTIQVEREMQLPNGEWLINGVVSGASISAGDTCQVARGDVTVEIIVTSVAMLNIDMVKHHLAGLVVQICSDKPCALVGCTLDFE